MRFLNGYHDRIAFWYGKDKEGLMHLAHKMRSPHRWSVLAPHSMTLIGTVLSVA